MMNYITPLTKALMTLLLACLSAPLASAEDGYRLWLRYDRIGDDALRQQYAQRIGGIGGIETADSNRSPTLQVALDELERGLHGLIGSADAGNQQATAPRLLVGTPEGVDGIASLGLDSDLQPLGREGYLLKSLDTPQGSRLVITGNTDQGVLYGVFAFLRHLQMGQPLDQLDVASAPRIENRMLNHWDNLTRTVERTMAGASIWNWFDLPYYIEPYYIDYARANASIGINGTVLTNVNANATVLRPQFLEKVKALADTFRPYGIRVYLTARFSAPVEIGGLDTADPLDPQVQQWWKDKVAEIYGYIPDFGGFLVKANSEGQPGPQNYDRSHADGANLLADAVAPHGGIILWRAFVYDFEIKEDRHKQAYTEFVELEGQFRDNVLIQTKNGAIDFMPREPFHPLFGATPETPQAMELQITQEYLGGDVQLAFLAPMWKETLDSDTYARGEGSTVAKVVDGSVFDYEHTAIAGVSNIGNERNWTGHPLAQANWYAFGRLGWDHQLTSEQIADEWTRMSFSNDREVVEKITQMLLGSHETVVSYSMPLGLHHIMAAGHHYGPGPWHDEGRPDWTSVYYHQADEEGIGFDRTESGSNALAQYADEVAEHWGDLDSVEDKYLLWFHHLPWDYKMRSGRTLWEELCHTYQKGVEEARELRETWSSLEGKIGDPRFTQVAANLARQVQDAEFWRDACLSYFQTFSKRPIPQGVEKPEHDLEYYKKFTLFHVPGDPGEQ